MRALVGVVAVLGLGCVGSQVQVLPALTPVDATRPFFVYKPVQGTACGENATARAMDDLYRVAGDAHGFVSATIEQASSGCVTITARPISYGCTPAEPKKVDVYPMHVVPGETSCPRVVDACASECEPYSKALSSGETLTSAFFERCVTRCRNSDAAFMKCAHDASTAAAVRACDTMP